MVMGFSFIVGVLVMSLESALLTVTLGDEIERCL